MTERSQAADADAEAAAMTRRLLAAVDTGAIDATGAANARLRRRLEGAATAWEESARRRPRRRQGRSAE